MTTEMTPLVKPALPPKPVKYRAPPPPPAAAAAAAIKPPPATATTTATITASKPTVSAVTTTTTTTPTAPSRRQKYRAPAPPTSRPPPPPPPSTYPPAPPASGAAVSGAAATHAVAVPVMRREPMQVLPSSVAQYERCLERSAASAAASSTFSTELATSTALRGDPEPVLTIAGKVPRDAEPRRDSSSESEQRPSESSDDGVRPIVRDVKLLERNSVAVSAAAAARAQRLLRSWRSTESIDRLITPTATGPGDGSARSSFVDPTPVSVTPAVAPAASAGARRSVYLDLGDYQTLLKHGHQDAVYSLPQPHCYGDETLRAVRLITEKYDTFKRRQLRAMSFRDAAGVAAAAAAAADGVKMTSSAPHSSSDDVTDADEATCKLNVEDGGTATQRRVALDTVAATSPTSPDGLPPTTLSRSVLTLTRSGLQSTSSQYDVTSPPESAVVDDADCGVSRVDRLRVEMFYRSQETEVYVCSCLAELCVGALAGVAGASRADRWVHLHTGVPVWLLSSGRGRRRRELHVVLAERRTALPLWTDRISYLSNYTADDEEPGAELGASSSHVMRLSTSLSNAVRLSMFNRRSAAAFLERFHQLTADPVDELWRISDDRTRAPPRRTAAGVNGDWRRLTLLAPWQWPRQRQRRSAAKESISQPCHVVLISRVDLRQPCVRAAFAHLLPPTPSAASPAVALPAATAVDCPSVTPTPAVQTTTHYQLEDEHFRPRLPTR